MNLEKEFKKGEQGEQSENKTEAFEYIEEENETNLEEDMGKKKIKRFEEKLEKCKKEKEEYLLGWQRAKADFINYTKDEERRKEEIKKWLSSDLIRKILPVFDDLEKALKYIPKEIRNNTWIKGIIQIQEKFKEILKKEGIEEVKTVGQKFNPEFHEAVEYVNLKEKAGMVVEEMQKGYTLDGVVIRAAKVKVAK